MKTWAFDYDDTITADIYEVTRFMANLDAKGHTVIIVTQRCAKYEAELREALRGYLWELPIVWAAGKGKREAAEEAGYSVDVWMDDYPEAVTEPRRYRGC